MTQQVLNLKDKSKLRDIFAEVNPEMWYKKCTFHELFTLDISKLEKPFVVKPLRGFASICIKAIHNKNEWKTYL